MPRSLVVDEQFVTRAEPKRTRIFCILAVVAVLIATLWPFDPFPRNGVSWLHGTNGLKFEKAGLVLGGEPLKLAESDTESCSVELLIRPASAASKSTILAFYTPGSPKQFMVRQIMNNLLVTHDSAIESVPTNTIKFDIDGAFRSGRLVLVAISSGPNGTAVYLDGQPAGSFPRFKISRNELSGEIVLGTSPINYAPWLGELRGLAIYSKQLAPADALRHSEEWGTPRRPAELDGAVARYTFADGAGDKVSNDVVTGSSLNIPAVFSMPHKEFLRSAAKEFKPNWKYAKDVLLNIAGFVPLGFIVCAYLVGTRKGWTAILIPTIACGMLSLMIEVLQYFIPRRGSGITDIITNTLGAALGAALMQWSAARRFASLLSLR
jgi:VanZ family protein